ncbi:MAG: hypothetical protein JXR73_01885 [Candidatus Omnitrophica bacterium]|nr:hypothetical protein [Candidatus Omnitrophota bacterium]
MKRVRDIGLLFCILLYAAFLSLPHVTEVGYIYLRDTAKKAQSEMERLSDEVESFRREHGRYPRASAAGWITEASLTVDGEAVFLIATGNRSEYIFDPFIADAYTQPYRYYSDCERWHVIVCNGPDQDADIDSNFIETFAKPSYQNLAPRMYNPGNGYRSGGDVVVIGPREDPSRESK